MKTIIKTVPKYIRVEDGVEKVKAWVAIDGREFAFKSDCEKHEKSLENEEKKKKFDAIESKTFMREDGDVCYNWYFVKNQDDVDVLFRNFGFNNGYDDNYVNNRNVGRTLDNTKSNIIKTWVRFEYEDGGDYRGDRSLYTSDYDKSNAKEELDFLNKL